MNLELHLTATLPVLAPLLAAVFVLLLDVAVPHRREPHLIVAALGLAAGALATVPGLGLAAGDARGAFCLPSGECLYAASRLVSVLQLTALLAALVVLVLAWRDWTAPGPGGGRETTGRSPVVAALALGATGGVVAVPAAGDLGTLLVALELATLPTVALVALVRTTWAPERRARAVEGAVSLLTTSLVSFALLALGAGLWVAATGTALLGGATTVEQPALLVLAAVFLVAGLAFKVSAVPFHAWTPITYAAAPLPVTTYLATVSKVAALGGLIVVVQALGVVDETTLVGIAVLAAASMTLGNLVALTQTDTVRLLAWSTVAQAGWVLLPLASLSSRAAHAATSYLVVYVTATLLAFVVVIAVAAATTTADPAGRPPVTALASHQGLLRARPLLALPLALALLALAGLPPAVVGVVAKIVALRPVLGDGIWWLAVVAALNIALGVAVYVRWLAVVVGPVRPGPAPGADPGPDHVEGPAPTPARVWVLVAVLTALLLAGSVLPVGIV
ncbi:NADH-quinone oxidoreductase subunit N [Ornithinimicrobium pratense]|uniref:NADH/ubiquinone/plastoquinone n=1 Tax=Ornithinimicrobium pratense TaxID=2593973 RepID=A0A5J6V7P3_9MICO|nr:proton-conducting transporter membrane subunit [Ornithinimicrobium pratense]QFG69364.1 NADH/ubiquinone/plastoquinone [Ornithinimicrobium pratense]